jgi:hypothetical protein
MRARGGFRLLLGVVGYRRGRIEEGASMSEDRKEELGIYRQQKSNR